MNAYCECLMPPQIVFKDPAELCLQVVWILNNLKRVMSHESLAINRRKKPSGSFCRENGHFPIDLYSECPSEPLQMGRAVFLVAHKVSRMGFHPMSARWTPVTWLAWVRIMESSLHRLTRLFPLTNLKPFAGLQTSILCSSLTEIPLNLNPPLCAVGHCWAFPLTSQCHALRKMKNAAFVAALSEHHL